MPNSQTDVTRKIARSSTQRSPSPPSCARNCPLPFGELRIHNLEVGALMVILSFGLLWRMNFERMIEFWTDEKGYEAYISRAFHLEEGP